MGTYELATLVLAIGALLISVSWIKIARDLRSIASAGRDLKEKYGQAITDGTITDAEKTVIADAAIVMIESVIEVAKELTNIALALKRIILRR